MSINSKAGKEVSCKPLLPILEAARRKNLDLDETLKGIPYDLSYLSNKHERIEWWVWCKIIGNLRPYFTLSDFEQMGKDFVRDKHYIEGYVFAFMFFSSGKLAGSLRGQISKVGSSILKPVFSCLDTVWEIVGKNNVRVNIYLKPGYEQCPEWFHMTKGVWEQLGTRVGLKGFRLHLSINSNGGVYVVWWDEAGLLTRLRKWALWLFNIRKAFADLTESHEQLLNNYNKLEESRKLLQKQTTQLTTAYNIAKSIRQSLDIHTTLNTITGALVNDAGLSFARIKIFKDIEGNAFEAEASNGAAGSNERPIRHPVLINDEKIGELDILPRSSADISELDELLNYLLPIIDVSIHDSLVIRTVTDYKNNLEVKVESRTAELKEAQAKLSEIIRLQNRFFTNISHEFRTPLTLILGPVKQIIQMTHSETFKNDLKGVYKNASRLLELVNQLLDLSKLESGSTKLQAVPKNVIPFLKSLALSFTSHAKRKGITLTFKSTADDVLAYIDEDKVEKIVTNILSNAFKFTPEGGRIEVEARKDKEHAIVRISDTGIGIAADKIPRVFDRFYQVDGSHTREQKGTGIGLSLTKELIELHRGTIEIESVVGKGTTFLIRIPLGNKHLKQEEIYESEKDEVKKDRVGGRVLHNPDLMIHLEALYSEKSKSGTPNEMELPVTDAERPLLLIVEDNADVRNFIRKNVQGDFRVLEAVDGEDGWAKSIEQMPDVIVSDVMMPKMDGFKLCDKLKSDERTSHIPVVLLTAKASGQDKLQGLATGADDYITKPFEPEEVHARIRNLIEQRKRVHEYLRKHGLFEIDENKITSVDRAFLRNALTVITEHMSDASFGVEALAENMAVSRSLLLKKIEALIGEAPSELIKRTRLNRAAKLIEGKFGNISEIALEVGFDNPSHFAQCFKNQFGCSPSHYHRSSPDQ